MSEETILISKARYDDIMERLKKYDNQKNKIDDAEDGESIEDEGGRIREDILRDNRALLPPGLRNIVDDDDDDDGDKSNTTKYAFENIPKEKTLENSLSVGRASDEGHKENSLSEGRVSDEGHEDSKDTRRAARKQTASSVTTQPRRRKEHSNKKASGIKKTWITL